MIEYGLTWLSFFRFLLDFKKIQKIVKYSPYKAITPY